MRALRYLKHNFTQRISYDAVLTRLGELARENEDAVAKMFIHDGASNNLLVGGGGRLTAPNTTQFRISGPALWMHKVNATDVARVIHPANTDYTFTALGGTLGNLGGSGTKIDLIEGRWKKVATLTATVDIINPSTGAISQSAATTDNEIQLEVNVSPGSDGNPCPNLTAGSAAVFTSTVVVTGTIDLTTNYNLNISLDGSAYSEIDCRGGTASATTLVEIRNAINAVYAGLTAIVSNRLVFTSSTVGLDSLIEFMPPPSGNDGTGEITGLTESFGYHYIYQGDADYFKIGEVVWGAGAAADMTVATLLDVDEKASWDINGDENNMETLYSMYELQELFGTLGADIVIVRQSGGNVPQLTWDHWFGTAPDFAGAPTTTGGGWTISSASTGVEVPSGLRILLGECQAGSGGTAKTWLNGGEAYSANGPIYFLGTRNVAIEGVAEERVGVELPTGTFAPLQFATTLQPADLHRHDDREFQLGGCRRLCPVELAG
jgi:hypothetical protein